MQVHKLEARNGLFTKETLIGGIGGWITSGWPGLIVGATIPFAIGIIAALIKYAFARWRCRLGHLVIRHTGFQAAKETDTP